jgi:hypothetical protein
MAEGGYERSEILFTRSCHVNDQVDRRALAQASRRFPLTTWLRGGNIAHRGTALPQTSEAT